MEPETDIIPEDEEARLAAVRRYDVLDTPPDGAFDRVTQMAARIFDVPVAIVSIVDRDRIWFKSHHGVEVEEIGRDPGLCASAILRNVPRILTDARLDPVALSNPLVAGEFGLRFYAAAPLQTRDGHNLGTLCVIDREPREPSEEQVATLQDLASVVMDELELRLAARRAVYRESSLRDEAESMAKTLQESLLPPRIPEVPRTEIATFYKAADPREVAGDFYDVFPLSDGMYGVVIGDVCGKGPRAAAATALTRYTVRTAAMRTTSPSAILAALNEVMVSAPEIAGDRYCTVVFATVDVADSGMRVRVANGGHPPALLMRPDGSTTEFPSTGPLLGWWSDAQFTEQEECLEPGDTLVLYTDGITEARVGAEEFGQEGLTALLGDAVQLSVKEVAAAVEQEFQGDGPRLRDDAALMVVRITA